MFIGKFMIENLEICIYNKLNLKQHLTEKSKSLMRATYSLFNIGSTEKLYIYKTYCRPINTRISEHI
jgi:hypothetical protein